MTITPRGSFLRAESPYRIRRRYQNRLRLFGLLTVMLTPIWVVAAYKTFRYILHMEFLAIMSLAMGQSMGAGQSGGSGGVTIQGARMLDPAFVEGTAHVWLTLMILIGAGVLIGGLKGLAARERARAWMIFAGLLIMAATILTLVGMWVLIRYGGFPPTVTALGYVVISGVQSFYGWVLLLVFARKPRMAL